MNETWIMNMFAVVAIIIGVGLVITWLPAMIVKAIGLARLRSACAGKLAITFDDGPDPKLTAALVELLRKHQAACTFYLVGFRALRSPESCDLLARNGHELGCHTHWHRKPWLVPPWDTARDVNQGFSHLEPWLEAGAAFRPPFGKLTTWSWLSALRRGARLDWWTCDGGDTYPQLPDPAGVAERIVQAQGGVVLLHSHDRGQDRHDYVLALTELLLQAARRQGLQICTMKELAAGRARVALGEIR